jgi:RNA polymerase sigma factor (sigma-70 family)
MDDYVAGLLCDPDRLKAELTRLKRLVGGRVREDEAEEIALETVAILWEQFGISGDTREPLRQGPAYATVVALRLASAVQRNQKRWPREPLAEEAILRSVDDQLGALDRRREVVDALKTLPISERTAMYLHYIEGHRVVDIASLLGKSESTVKNQLASARKRLGCLHRGMLL